MIRVRNVRTGRVSEFVELPEILRGSVDDGRLELVDDEPEEKPKRVRARVVPADVADLQTDAGDELDDTEEVS